MGEKGFMRKKALLTILILFLAFSSCKFTPFTPENPATRPNAGDPKSVGKDDPPPPLALQGETFGTRWFVPTALGDPDPWSVLMLPVAVSGKRLPAEAEIAGRER